MHQKSSKLHLVKSIQIIVVNLELHAPVALLKAASFGHLHIHGTDVLFIVLLLLLSPKSPKSKLMWLNRERYQINQYNNTSQSTLDVLSLEMFCMIPSL